MKFDSEFLNELQGDLCGNEHANFVRLCRLEACHPSGETVLRIKLKINSTKLAELLIKSLHSFSSISTSAFCMYVDRNGPVFPSKANNKCPAIIFAANVPGRIMFLTVSIKLNLWLTAPKGATLVN